MDRVEQAQAWLERERLDVVVLRLTENVVLYSGYLPQLGTAAVVLTPEHGATVVAPDVEAPDVECGWNKNVRYYRIFDGAAQGLRQVLQELCRKGSCRVGFEGSYESIAPCANFAEPNAVGLPTQAFLQSVFERAELVDVSAALDRFKATKTPYEIERIRIANEVAMFGLEAFKEAVAPGRREVDIAADVEKAILTRGTGYKGVRVARAVCQVTSGPQTEVHWRYACSSTRVVQPGETVMLEIGTMADGFWADQTRTLVAGRPSERHRELYQAVFEAQEAAFAASRPGAKAADVDEAARAAMRRHGLSYEHHTGHATGFRYHEPTLPIVPGSQQEVAVGMVHVAEPGVYIEGIGGFRLEDDVVVTERGAERLSRPTYDLD